DAASRVPRFSAGRVGRFVAFLALTFFAEPGAAGSSTPVGSTGGLAGTGSGTGHLVCERTVGLLSRIIAEVPGAVIVASQHAGIVHNPSLDVVDATMAVTQTFHILLPE